METDLLGFVLTELRSRRFKLTEVSVGAGVPYETLKKIALGTTPNPGVRHVQKLADFFRTRPAAAQTQPQPAGQEMRDAA